MKLSNTFINKNGELACLSYIQKRDLCELTCKVLPGCEGVPNINHIWFCKQYIVRDLYNRIKDDANLEELWIFGSATQERCTVESDLDIAYLYTGDDHAFRELVSNIDPMGVDMINMRTIDRHCSLDVQIRKGWRIV